MTRTKTATSLAFVFALCLAPCVAARVAQDGDAPRQSKSFERARQVRAPSSSGSMAFEFEVDGFSYHVAANGNGRRTKGNKTRRFNLRFDGPDFMEGMRFDVYEGDLLLACELNDGDAAGGLFVRLEQPSMRALWRQPVPSFNLGEPLREGRHLYLTGRGFVAKLDLRTGEYVWQHEDLYRETEVTRAGVSRDDFNSFETPELAGETVLFRARPVYNRRRTLVVNKKTGKIIRIE
jgi:hypothetical protein